MDSESLTRAQAKQLADTIHEQLGYLCRLRERMERRGWPRTDPIYQRVEAAYNVSHDLWVHLHYKSCLGSGETARDE